jgi:hypothetical protein
MISQLIHNLNNHSETKVENSLVTLLSNIGDSDLRESLYKQMFIYTVQKIQDVTTVCSLKVFH